MKEFIFAHFGGHMLMEQPSFRHPVLFAFNDIRREIALAKASENSLGRSTCETAAARTASAGIGITMVGTGLSRYL